MARVSCPDDLYRRATHHPFVLALGDGTLSRDRFDVWLQQDYHFVVGLRPFVKTLRDEAPAGDRPGLESGLAALDPELELFRLAGVDRTVAPGPACVAYLDFLRATAKTGYDAGLCAYYACERSYLDAWTTVKARGGPYAAWIANWTSEPFRAYVEWLGERLDAILIGLDGLRVEELSGVFAATIRHEIAFWDECFRR